MRETKFIAVIRKKIANTTYISTRRQGDLWWYDLATKSSKSSSWPDLLEYDSQTEAEDAAKHTVGSRSGFEVAAIPSPEVTGLLLTPTSAWKGLSLEEVLEAASTGIGICGGVHVEKTP